MNVSKSTFALLPNGKEAKLFCFEAAQGLTVSITNYGGIITSIKLPDKDGQIEEICAGFPNLEGYLQSHPFFGTLVGRYANRIANGHFTLDGIEYKLPVNNNPNHLHGGEKGFHTKLWDAELTQTDSWAALKLTYTSPHLEEGYPGNLLVTVTYTIHDDNVMDMWFFAKTDAPTHINITSHGYFNLNGFRNNIYDHQLWINAEQYLGLDANQIPTGNLVDCKGTPFDFTQTKELGPSIQLIPDGLDHCYVLNKKGINEVLATTLSHTPSGRQLSLYCSHPGIQVYTGNSLDGSLCGHNGTAYQKHGAICLEMQHFPDSPNHTSFPSTRLNPGEEYRQTAKLVFRIMP